MESRNVTWSSVSIQSSTKSTTSIERECLPTLPTIETSHPQSKRTSLFSIKIFGIQEWLIQQEPTRISTIDIWRFSLALSIWTELSFPLTFGFSKASVVIWILSSLYFWMWELNLIHKELSISLEVLWIRMLVVLLDWWVWIHSFLLSKEVMMETKRKTDAVRKLSSRLRERSSMNT